MELATSATTLQYFDTFKVSQGFRIAPPSTRRSEIQLTRSSHTKPTSLLRTDLLPYLTEVLWPNLVPRLGLPTPRLPQCLPRMEMVAGPGLLPPVVLLSGITRPSRFIPAPKLLPSKSWRHLWALPTLTLPMHHAKEPALWILIQTARSRTMPYFGRLAHRVSHPHGRMNMCLYKDSNMHSSVRKSIAHLLR